MPNTLPTFLLIGLFAVLLVTAMVTDIRSRTIGNGLTLSVALLALPWWLALHLSPWAMLGQLAVSTVVLVVFAVCFAIGMMGGGDVKLLAAIALWLPLGALAQTLVWMAVGGGILTLAMLAHQRLRRGSGAVEVPYGVAIAGATLLVVANHILTIRAA